MKKLSDPQIRKESCVYESNNFLFASTQLSELNVSGLHAFKDICNKLNLQNSDLINATSNRHCISTVYASLYLPQQERELFYSHMGHSEQMNKNVYQAPQALISSFPYVTSRKNRVVKEITCLHENEDTYEQS